MHLIEAQLLVTRSSREICSKVNRSLSQIVGGVLLSSTKRIPIILRRWLAVWLAAKVNRFRCGCSWARF